MDIDLIQSILYSAIRLSTPLVYAALAAAVAQRVGKLNLAIESIMLFSALTGVLVSAFTGSLIIGILGAVLAGVAVGVLISFCVFSMKTDLMLTCIAINIAASGGTILLMYLLAGTKGTTHGLLNSLALPKLEIPLIRDIPFLGGILSGHSVLTYLAVVIVFAVRFLINKTCFGLRLRAVGENEMAAETAGISVKKMNYKAFMLSSVLASLGGIFMSMDFLSWFTRNMISGRGFIGVSAASVAGGEPIATGIAALVFGFAESAANALSLTQIPTDLIAMSPYLLTVVIIVVISIVKKAKEKKRLQATLHMLQQDGG